MYGPVYSSLAVEASSMTESAQQELVNKACYVVDYNVASSSYYPRSWLVLSMMVLNGDAAKVGKIIRGETVDSPPAPTPNLVTPSPTSVSYCCSFDYKTCSTSAYCNGGQTNCEACGGLWISDEPLNCIALYEQCDASLDECCGPASCSYNQCQPGIYAPTTNPIDDTSNPTSDPTSSPIVASTPAPSTNPMEDPSPTASSTNSPTKKGCYSNNNKDCLPEGYVIDEDSCDNIVWLPDGAQENCLGLWKYCTGNPSSCCGESKCFGSEKYSVCVPSTETSSPSDGISSSPSSILTEPPIPVPTSTLYPTASSS